MCDYCLAAFSKKKNTFLFYFVCECFVCMYVSEAHVCLVPLKCQVLDLLELVLQTVVSPHVGAGN